MRQAVLDIELLEDCVFSARSASEGAHASLDRVPGSALLGAAAARLYGALGEQAFTVFHSGRVRFGDGLPLAGNAVACPVPMAWHYEKTRGYRSGDSDDRLDAARICNFQHTTKLPKDTGSEAPQQPKQMRSGYVTVNGGLIEPAHDVRMKTAIDRDQERAAEAQLFGYDALHRGQRFRALIEADEVVEQAVFDQVIEALQGEGLLGRSRSAEYGRVRITVEPGAVLPWQEAGAQAVGAGAGECVTLWLLSDLALVDARGQATAQPIPECFGIKQGEVLWDKTFLRTRRYSPWNAARRGYDAERVVLQAGGVITLRVPDKAERDALRGRVARGMGRYREAGLGRLWMNPALLAGEQPRFEAEAAGKPVDTRETQQAQSDHPLVHWLLAQDADWKFDVEKQAEKFVDEYQKWVEGARRLAGVSREVGFGPSRSQWGSVQSMASHKQGQALHRALFEGDDAVIRAGKDTGWDIESRKGGQFVILADWLKKKMNPDKFSGAQRDRAYAHFVRVAARRIQDNIGQRRS